MPPGSAKTALLLRDGDLVQFIPQGLAAAPGLGQTKGTGVFTGPERGHRIQLDDRNGPSRDVIPRLPLAPRHFGIRFAI